MLPWRKREAGREWMQKDNDEEQFIFKKKSVLLAIFVFEGAVKSFKTSSLLSTENCH